MTLFERDLSVARPGLGPCMAPNPSNRCRTPTELVDDEQGPVGAAARRVGQARAAAAAVELGSRSKPSAGSGSQRSGRSSR